MFAPNSRKFNEFCRKFRGTCRILQDVDEFLPEFLRNAVYSPLHFESRNIPQYSQPPKFSDTAIDQYAVCLAIATALGRNGRSQ